MTNLKEICPICEEGHLQHKVDSHSVEYHGQHANLDIHFSVCTACGSEQAGADELRKNKRIMIEFRKKVDGLLTGSQVRSIRKKLGLSQAEAARVFGGGPVAFSKYENDDVTQSEAMDKLLRLASDIPAAFEHLCHFTRVESNLKEQVSQIRNRTSTPSSGCVLGIDTGWSTTRATSAICRLNWNMRYIEWKIERFRATEYERKRSICRLTKGKVLRSAAIDGPLRLGFDKIDRYRSAELLLSRGELAKRIGKPGQSNSPNGKKLNEQANLSANILKDYCKILEAQSEIKIDSLAIHEAFPTSFLGVMVDYTLAKESGGRKKKSDQYYEYLVDSGNLESLLLTLLPDRKPIQQLASIRNHDDRAALVCAITALCVAERKFSAVGDSRDGWIILPPTSFYQSWALEALHSNLQNNNSIGSFLSI